MSQFSRLFLDRLPAIFEGSLRARAELRGAPFEHRLRAAKDEKKNSLEVKKFAA
jgi:hypothetical protein